MALCLLSQSGRKVPRIHSEAGGRLPDAEDTQGQGEEADAEKEYGRGFGGGQRQVRWEALSEKSPAKSDGLDAAFGRARAGESIAEGLKVQGNADDAFHRRQTGREEGNSLSESGTPAAVGNAGTPPSSI
jgi:hypothetical protein